MQVRILPTLTAAPCVGPELHANSEGRIAFMGLNRPRYSITEAAYEGIDLHNSPEVSSLFLSSELVAFSLDESL
jgi:hypothetical protein